MKIEQIYTGCLAQGAYYIESEGEAAIIDPLRESEPYLKKATQNGVKIKYIFETHFHADFVSGHLDLAKKTDAKIIYGPLANTAYEKHTAKDGETFQLGKLTFKVLHTPGHTPESTTYLLLDENKNPHAIFTGDTLFIGDVGRPDLSQKDSDTSQEEMAGWLYDSLRQKIMVLPDEVIVYPAHGAGSACGKNMSKETWDTLGHQKQVNYALRADMTKAEFIQEVTAGLLPPPQYFAKNANLNKNGYESIDKVMQRGAKALNPREFELVANETNALVLDVRNRDQFVKGFIPNSIFIGLDGSFAPWVGALVKDLHQPILIVAPEGKEKESITRLARVGYDNTIGYLKGGFEAWKDNSREVEVMETIDAATFAQRFKNQPNIKVLDVRNPTEFGVEHVKEAQHFPLDFISQHMASIQSDNTYYLHCRSGYRSTIAASILMSRGFKKLVNVQDKFADFAAAGLPISDFSCSKSQSK